MNETLQTIFKRHTTREFSPREVEDDKLETVLKAGISAPTGKNMQSLALYALKDKEKIKRLTEFLKGNQYYGAPCIIFVLDKNPSYLSDLNCGAAIENMLLAATSLDLSACWVHCTRELLNTDEGKALLKDILGLSYLPTCLDTMALGYNDKPYTLKSRNEEYHII